jgi:hypothetical protein
MLPESRIVARLLLENVNAEDWRHAIETENVLQKRSVGTAARQANLIRSRLSLMDSAHWELVLNGTVVVATQALLAAAVKHSRLLADFMDLSLRDLYRRLEKEVPKSLWVRFLEGCAARDAEMPDWSETTQTKLKQTVYQILSQAGYFSDTRRLELRRVDIAPELRSYLVSHKEKRVLKCLEVCP